jgi:hypothetical protein
MIDDDDDDCGAIARIRIGRGNRSTWGEPSPVPLCSPKILHDLTCARTRTAAVGSLRLTSSAMAWHYFAMKGLKIKAILSGKN